MSALTDLFEGNFSNIGHDITSHFSQDLPYYLLAATAAVGGAGLAGVGPAAGLFGGSAAADAGIGAVGWEGAAGQAAIGGTSAAAGGAAAAGGLGSLLGGGGGILGGLGSLTSAGMTLAGFGLKTAGALQGIGAVKGLVGASSDKIGRAHV